MENILYFLGEKCFFSSWNFMFPVQELLYTGWKHLYTVQKHKFAVREHKNSTGGRKKLESKGKRMPVPSEDSTGRITNL